jgi:replication factor A1
MSNGMSNGMPNRQSPAKPAYPSYGNTGSAPPSYGNPTPAPSYPSYGSAVNAASNPGGYSGYGGSKSSAPVVKADLNNSLIVPINAVNPYNNKWVILARVTRKSDKRTWQNARGSGTLFNIELMDKEGTEIRATFFKEACEKFYPVLEEGKVYTFSSGKLKVVQNPQYSSIKNPYELTFDLNSEICMAESDDFKESAPVMNFVKIAKIADQDVGNIIDALGIVKSASDVQVSPSELSLSL